MNNLDFYPKCYIMNKNNLFIPIRKEEKTWI